VLGQAGVAAAGLGGLRLLTTLLTPDQFGRLVLGISLAMLLQQVAFGPLAVAALRHAGRAIDEAELHLLVSALDRLNTQAFLGSLLVSAIAASVVHVLDWSDWLLFGALTLWFGTALGLLGTRLAIDAAQRHRGWVSGMQVGTEVGKYGAAWAAIALIGAASAAAAMAGFATATTVAAVVQRSRARGGPKDRPEANDWRASLLRVARPLAATGALTWSQMASDRWALNAVLTTGHVGAYGVVYQIAVAPFTLLGAMVQQLVAPVVFRMAGSGRDSGSIRASHRYVLASAGVLLIGTAAGALLAWRFHEAIFGIFVGPGFAQYSHLLPLGVVAGGFLAAGQVVGVTVLSRDAAGQLILPKAVTAALGLVLNILGAVFLGVAGVLWANVVYSLVFLVWLAIIALGPGEERGSQGTRGSLP
jgi:O-antigen/teichoic acid export membrane protein